MDNRLNEVTWNIKEILNIVKSYNVRNDKILCSNLEKLRELISQIKENDSLSKESLLEFCQRSELVYSKIDGIMTYFNLLSVVDINRDEYTSLGAKFQSEYNSIIDEIKLNESIIINTLKDNSDLFLAVELKNYDFYLKKLLEIDNYQFDTKMEQMIRLKDEYGFFEWSKLQKRILDSKKFQIKFNDEENDHEYDFNGIVALRNDKDSEKRKLSITQGMKQLINDKEIYATCLRSIFSNHYIMSKERKYNNILDQSLFEDQISPKLLDEIIEEIKRNKDIFQESLKLKASNFGSDRLKGEDLWASLPIKSNIDLPWDNAVNIVNQSLKKFDYEFSEHFNYFLRNNLIDAKPRANKTSGAFCGYSPYDKLPYIFLNYRNSFGSLSDLAHEVGHGIHAKYSLDNQTTYNSLFTPIISETASEFVNYLVFSDLTNKVHPEEKKYILLRRILNINTAIFVVAFRHIFEEEIYNSIEKNEYLDTQKIVQLYKKSRLSIFGDAVEFYPEQFYDWIWTAHFYFTRSPYNNYQYILAELLVLSLINIYNNNDKKKFVENYKCLLKLGNSVSSRDALLKTFSIDINDINFWKRGFNYLSELFNETKTSFDN